MASTPKQTFSEAGVQAISRASATVVNSGARLDRLPVSRFHRKMLLLIGGGSLIDAFDIYLAAGVIAALVKNGFATLAQTALFLSVTFIGMTIGAAFAGYIGDRLGRRASYQFNLLLFGVCALFAAFAPNMTVLIALRFLMGIGLGAELVVATGTLGEFIPPSHRGRFGALLALVVSAGLPIASWTGYLVIPTYGWRYMFGIAGVAAIVMWIARKTMPESPRWLESVGRTEEAEHTLAAIEREVEAQSGKPLPPIGRVQDLRVESSPLSALVTVVGLRRLIIGCIIAVSSVLSIYGFVIWMPTFFVQQGFAVTRSLGFTSLITAGAMLGPIVGTFFADKLSRAHTLIGASVLAIVLGGIFPLMTSPVGICVIGLLLVTTIYFIVSLGQYGLLPELFPTAYRLRANGIANLCARLASIGVPFGTLGLYKAFGVFGVVGAMAVILLAMIVALLAINVQTNQTSLEDI